MGSRIFSVLARLVVDHRRVTLVLVALLVAGAGYAALGLRADFTPEDLFAVDPAAEEAEDHFNSVFGTRDNAVLLLVEADDVLTLPVLEHVHQLSRELGALERVESVESVTASAFARFSAETGELAVRPPVEGDHVEADELAAIQDLLAQSALVERRVIGANRKVAVVALLLEADVDRIGEMEEVVARIEARLAELDPPEGVTVSLSGLPHLRVSVVRTLWEDQTRLSPLALVVGLLLMWLTVRWSVAPILTSVTVTAAGILTLGGMALAGVSIDVLNQAIPALIIIVSSSECIHIAGRYVEEARHRGPGTDAARATVRTMALACLLTTLTNAVGFASLTTSHSPLMQSFGLLACAGILTSYVVSLTLLPAALSYTKPPRRVVDEEASWLARLSEACFAFSLRRPWTVTLVAGAIVVSSIALSSSLPVDTSLSSYFADEHPIARTNSLVEEELSGAFPMEVFLTSPQEGRFDDPAVLNALSGLAAWAETQPGILGATAYPSHLHEAWVAFAGDTTRRQESFRTRAQVASLASLLEGAEQSPLHQFVTPDRRHTRISLQSVDQGARAGLELARRVQTEAEARLSAFPDVRVQLTGKGFVLASGLETVLHDMLRSFSVAFVVIFVSIGLLFRSLRVGLLSIAPNIAPNFLVLGYMALRDIPLDWNNAVVFAVGTGLAVEDTVHIFARLREELAAGATVDQALMRAARGTGRSVLLASIMLVAGFAVIATSSFVALQHFGELLMVIALTALVFDLTATPALVKLGYKPRRERSPSSAEAVAAVAGSQEG